MSPAPPALLGAAALLVLSVFAPGAPEVDLAHRFAEPSAEFLLGTDHLGRSLAARLAAGAGSAALVMLATATISFFGGLALAAGMLLLPPLLALSVQRLTDLSLAIPSLVLALVIGAAIGLEPISAAAALSVGGAAGTAHLAFGLLTAARAAGHVRAADALGGTPLHVLLRHVLPSVAPALVLAQCYDAARVLVSWSALAFLGLGADPSRSDWGTMVWEYRLFLFDEPRLVLVPIAAIGWVAWSFSVLGDPTLRRGERVARSTRWARD